MNGHGGDSNYTQNNHQARGSTTDLTTGQSSQFKKLQHRTRLYDTNNKGKHTAAKMHHGPPPRQRRPPTHRSTPPVANTWETHSFPRPPAGDPPRAPQRRHGSRHRCLAGHPPDGPDRCRHGSLRKRKGQSRAECRVSNPHRCGSGRLGLRRGHGHGWRQDEGTGKLRR